jgi:hypothetical protein
MTRTAPSRYTGYRFPPEIISHAVWLYFRFALSLRMVEEMLAARGIVVSHKTVRQWALKFGQAFANETRRRLPQTGDKWHVEAMLAIGHADAVCRRLMTVPGVGALVAVTFRSAVDDPQRFATSKAVGAHFGLTPKKYQSGETDVTGAVSKVGDALVRTALYEAAHIMLTRAVRFSGLKRWAMNVATRRGMKRAKVALARKLAVVLHAMWRDGTDFRWGKEAAAAA